MKFHKILINIDLLYLMSNFSHLAARHFKNHGYVVLEPRSDPQYLNNIKKAQTIINHTLEETFPDALYPKNKEEAEKWVVEKSKIQTHPDILGLIDSQTTKI